MPRSANTAMVKKQQGAVLLVALVLLLIMTLMGVSGMQGAKLQSKMAGNFQDQEIAFQMAELALREGEVWLNGLTEEPTATSNPGVNEVWEEEQLTDTVKTKGGWIAPDIDTTFWAAQRESQIVNTTIGENASGTGGYIWSLPKYTISYAGITQTNQSAAVGLGYGSQDKKIRLYRITAFGVGGRENTQITLQSVFTREFFQ